VTVGGGALPAVRVEAEPGRAGVQRHLAGDVRAAIVGTNANRPKGAVEDGDPHWQIGANDQARTAADYAPLIVRYATARRCAWATWREVADSVQDVRNYGWPTASRRCC
jgi:multidrug efflux pump